MESAISAAINREDLQKRIVAAATSFLVISKFTNHKDDSITEVDYHVNMQVAQLIMQRRRLAINIVEGKVGGEAYEQAFEEYSDRIRKMIGI